MPAGTQVRLIFLHPISGDRLVDDTYPSIAAAAVAAMSHMDKIPKPYRVTISNLRHWKAGPKSFDEQGCPLGYQRDKFDPHCFIWIGPPDTSPKFELKSLADAKRDVPFGGVIPESKPVQLVETINLEAKLGKAENYTIPDNYRAHYSDIVQPSNEPEVFIEVETNIVKTSYQEIMTEIRESSCGNSLENDMMETITLLQAETNRIANINLVQSSVFHALSDWILLAFYLVNDLKASQDPVMGFLYSKPKLDPIRLPLTKVQVYQIRDICNYLTEHRQERPLVSEEIFDYYESKLFDIECLFYDKYGSHHILRDDFDLSYTPTFALPGEEDDTEEEQAAKALARRKDFNRVAYRRRDQRGRFYYIKTAPIKENIYQLTGNKAERKLKSAKNSQQLRDSYLSKSYVKSTSVY